jgi:uncharacterized protein involved in outer membrane biogenesis
MRRLLLLLGGVPATLILLVLGALAAVNSKPARLRIANALSGALGQPVVIRGLSVSLLPFPALSASDVRVGGADGSAAADSTAAPGVFLPELRVVPRLSSLLPGRPLTVDRVELTRAVIAVRRDTLGRWVLPVPPVRGADSAAQVSRSRSVALNDLQLHDGTLRVIDDRLRTARGTPSVTSISGIEATMRAGAGRVVIPRLTGRLGGTAVNGATQIGPEGAELRLQIPSIEAADLPLLFALAGLEPNRALTISGKAPLSMVITAPRGSADHTVVGKASIERATLGRLPLQAVATSFRFNRGILTLDPLTFTTYRGRQRGVVTVDVTGPTAMYSVRTSIEGLDMNEALSATTRMKDFLVARAGAAGTVSGRGHTAAEVQRNIAGTVQFKLSNGVLKRFPLLATINQALGLTSGSGSDTRFEDLHGTAQLGGGKAQLRQLSVTAGELSFAGTGVVDFDHQLDLHLIARLSPKAAGAIAQQANFIQRLQSANGEITFPVTIRGTTDNPKFGVDLRSMAEQQVKQELGRRLEELLQGR